MEIAPGIYSLSQQEGGHVHAFLLDDGKELTVIDTLWDTDGQRILDQIKSIGRSVTDLKHIILTHAHRSHLGGLAALKKASGATVYAHEWEADIISGERKAQGITVVPMRPLHLYLQVYPLQVGLALGFGQHPPCPVDHYVTEGDKIGPIEVMHAAGHSPGHLSFYWQQKRALFAGDAIATWPEFAGGWYAFNLNEKQHQATLNRMGDFDAEIVAVGHGDPITTGGAERVRSLFTRTKW